MGPPFPPTLQPFIQDNARLHTARKTMDTIRKLKWDLLSHPPPDLDDILSDAEDSETFAPQNESTSDFSVDEGPQLFSQIQLNDLVRDLGLSKDAAELLGSRLKNKNLLSSGTSFSWYRHREREFTQYFTKEGNLVYCNDVRGLMKCFEIEYDSSEWRLFIDSSKTSLKAVLLHNGNVFASLPMGHSVHMKEHYNDLATIIIATKRAIGPFDTQ